MQDFSLSKLMWILSLLHSVVQRRGLCRSQFASFLPCSYLYIYIIMFKLSKWKQENQVRSGIFDPVAVRTHHHPLFQKYNNAKASIDTHSSFTFLGVLFCRVQLFAAEVTLRKHSCFSGIWCHHRTTRPVLIFNKDKTFISQLQTVRAWRLREREEEINKCWLFFGVIYRNNRWRKSLSLSMSSEWVLW